MKINDFHFHVGQFYNNLITPGEVENFVRKLNINKIAISSTTSCAENYDNILKEFYSLERLLSKKLYSLLWLTPKMINSKAIDKLLNSGINWKGFKIHGLQNNWTNNNLIKVIKLAQQYSVLIKFHTGGHTKSDAKVYKDLIQKYNNQIFVLAHGRPISQALDILKDCSNAWVDTAFMPVKNIELLVKSGYSNKVLFGSDYPIFKMYYPKIKEDDYYIKLLSDIKNIIGSEDFGKITFHNFESIFS